MSKNGKSSMTPKAKGAAMRNREKMYRKALNLGMYNKPEAIANLCHEAWAGGYFYAKQEKLSKPKDTIEGNVLANGMGEPILHLWDKGKHLIGKKVKVVVIEED